MKMKYDWATLLDLEIKENSLKLEIGWGNYYPKPFTNDYSAYEIKAKKIEWEKIE
jgi:hypothetical protein